MCVCGVYLVVDIKVSGSATGWELDEPPGLPIGRETETKEKAADTRMLNKCS